MSMDGMSAVKNESHRVATACAPALSNVIPPWPFKRPSRADSREDAIGVPAKLQVVGQNQVRQAAAVPLELVASLGVIQIDAHVLALDITYRDAAVFHDEVRSAALHV